MSDTDIAIRKSDVAKQMRSNIPPYSDNMTLLFHGTRADLKTIFSQGLDARLGNQGLLGVGIYFADDPKKCINYDSNNTVIVCAVLLGDCVASNSNVSKREPDKPAAYRRHPYDTCFNSIIG